jgi:inosine/xanthosine triphosphate pyrophosphatase family protein
MDSDPPPQYNYNAYAFWQLGESCITEDTALCFAAYNGLPGPYIKHFMKTLGHEGQLVQGHFAKRDFLNMSG